MNNSKLSVLYKYRGINLDSEYDLNLINESALKAIEFSETLNIRSIFNENESHRSFMRIIRFSASAIFCFRHDLSKTEILDCLGETMINTVGLYNAITYLSTLGYALEDCEKIEKGLGRSLANVIIDKAIEKNNRHTNEFLIGIDLDKHNYPSRIDKYFLSELNKRRDIDKFTAPIENKHALGEFALDHQLSGFSSGIPKEFMVKLLENGLGL